MTGRSGKMPLEETPKAAEIPIDLTKQMQNNGP